MKIKTTTDAPASAALIHFLTHGQHDFAAEGAFDTFQLANPSQNYEDMRPHWERCRAWILAARRPGDPAPWGSRFDSRGGGVTR